MKNLRLNLRTRAVAMFTLLAIATPPGRLSAQSPPPTDAQLDKLVAPIALYPDPLVAQILPASTYPVQVIEAARDLQNGGRPDKQTASQWDPSVQALLSFPTVLQMMSDKADWTTQLGQAVAANQGNVMAAVQRVRAQAQAAGNLKSSDKQVVTTQGSGASTTIIVEPADPQVIYVPQYNPTVILEPAPSYAGYGMAPPAYGLMTFGLGFAAGAATAYACNWGHGSSSNVTVNNNYSYNQANKYSNYHPMSANAGHGGQYSSWHAPKASAVGRSAGNYRASQYQAGGIGHTGYHNTLPSSSQFHGDEMARGDTHGGGDTGELGGSHESAGRDSGGGGFGEHSGGGGFDGHASGGDAFHGVGGGGGGEREASARGASSFGGFHGGGGGGGGGFHGGGGRGRR